MRVFSSSYTRLGLLGKTDVMIEDLFDDLEVNHIGIIIPLNMRESIERESGNRFIEDKIQGVSVCFVWDDHLKIHKEYITKEGRAAGYRLGFNHVCYDIDSKDELKRLHNIFLKKRIGIRLTLPEASPTKQCNIVSFYKIVGLGIVEFNIVNSYV